MPVDPNASVRISAFNWVPPFAQGQVRDLRPRWALAEAGIAYDVRKLDAMMQMKRIDIAALQRAADGLAPSA